MDTLLFVGRLYRRLDALLRHLLPGQIRLWLKGLCVEVARKLLPARMGKPVGIPSILPAWAYATVCEVAIDEPELTPEFFIPYLRRSPIPTGKSNLGAGYSRLWKRIDQHARHVFVLGDANGRVPNFLLRAIKYLSTERSSHILVVWTGPSTAVFNDLPPQVQLLDLREVSSIQGAMEQAIILGRVLIEIKPATIHIASSAAAWAMFRSVTAALDECSHLYATLTPIASICDGAGAQEAERSIAFGLPKSIRLLADSTKTIGQWQARYGIDSAIVELISEDNFATTESGAAGCSIQNCWLSNLSGYTV